MLSFSTEKKNLLVKSECLHSLDQEETLADLDIQSPFRSDIVEQFPEKRDYMRTAMIQYRFRSLTILSEAFLYACTQKAAILVAVHFSMQNIELSRDLGRALGRGYESIRLYCSVFTYVCVTSATYNHDVERGESAAGLFQDLC